MYAYLYKPLLSSPSANPPPEPTRIGKTLACIAEARIAFFDVCGRRRAATAHPHVRIMLSYEDVCVRCACAIWCASVDCESRRITARRQRLTVGLAATKATTTATATTAFVRIQCYAGVVCSRLTLAKMAFNTVNFRRRSNVVCTMSAVIVCAVHSETTETTRSPPLCD